jgi:hypothetical protein
LNLLFKENDMNPSENPARLRGLLGRDSALGRGIEAARSSGPSDEQLKALERSVLASIGVSAVTVTAVQGAKGAGAVASWFSAGATKLVLALTVAAVAGGGALVIRHQVMSTAKQQAAVSAPARAEEKTVPARLPSTPENAQPAPSDVVTPDLELAQQLAAGKARSAARAHGRLAGGTVAADEEIPLLERAHRALSGAPAVALRLATEHARRFPLSSLDQERELIAVTALVDLGRTAQARRLARRFAEEHPGSAYVGRIENILREHPSR